MDTLIAWIMRAIPFGTIIMYGAMGEIVTEKCGNLNLGVPGIIWADSPVSQALICMRTPPPIRTWRSAS